MDTSKKIIVFGLVGKAGVGKDTAYCVLRSTFEKKLVVRVSFGDEIKQEYSMSSGIPVEELESNKSEYRRELQNWGTEYRRSQDENYWIEKIKPQVSILSSLVDVMVFTDVRFHNEAEYIKQKFGGFIIKVKPHKSFRVGKHHRHISEMELDDIVPDYILPNDGGEGEMSMYWRVILKEIQENESKHA